MKYKIRIEDLKKRLDRERLDCLFVNKKENIAYLCGFYGEGSTLLITAQGEDFIITDSRFKQDADEKLPELNVALTDGSLYNPITKILKKYKTKRLGFESEWLPYNGYLGLKKNLKKIRLVPKKDLVEDMRIIKDTQEIGLIKKSIAIAKRAFLYAKERIDPKQSGQGLATIIDNSMRRCGASRPAFQTIVAQNPYSSSPHASATQRPFGKGSAVLIDMGAVYEGYNSDLTRMLFLGRITRKFKYIYSIIKMAQRKAVEKIRPGISAYRLDNIARGHVAKKGLGKFFIHGLGHGLGLEIHEPPNVSKTSKTILRPGMVFTVEPAVYIRGWGGLRVEDVVVVTKNGCKVLTDDIPK